MKFYGIIPILALLPSHVVARAVLSTGGGGVATSLSRDKSTGELMMVGTTYAEFWGIERGRLDKVGNRRCFIANGYMSSQTFEFERRNFHNPEMCYGDALTIPSEDDDDDEDGKSLAVVTGVSALGEPKLVTFYDYDQPENEFYLEPNHFPVAMIHAKSDKVILALHEGDTMTFQDEQDNQDSLKGLLEYWEHFTVPTKTTSSQLRLQMISTATGRVQFDTQISTIGGNATIAGMQKVPGHERFVIAGSTNGSGAPFGDHPTGKNDWDGYVAIYDSTMGELVFQGNDHRIRSIDGKDDFVHGICTYKHDLYIVGTTNGKMNYGFKHSGGAFLVKMNLESGQIEWRRQISEPHKTHEGLSCAASRHHGVVIGGNAKKIKEDTSQEVFVSRFDSDGTQLWMKYLDTNRLTSKDSDDMLAGLDLTREGELHALLNTRVLEKGVNGIFLVDIDIDSGNNRLSRYEWMAPETEQREELKIPLHFQLFITGSILLLLALAFKCRYWLSRFNSRREKIILDHLAKDPDYMDGQGYSDEANEIWDYDKNGFVEQETGMRVNLRDNHLAFIMA